jgi:hypothetical protein
VVLWIVIGVVVLGLVLLALAVWTVVKRLPALQAVQTDLQSTVEGAVPELNERLAETQVRVAEVQARVQLAQHRQGILQERIARLKATAKRS